MRIQLTRRRVPRRGPAHAWTAALATLAAAALLAAGAARAAAPTTAPQVLLAVTNSESMDGTTAGAIMVGSGGLGSANATLSSSSSPTNYAIPSGFTPPLSAGSGGVAPYTVTCNTSYECDNGPSRMNMTKTAISSVIANYAASLNFGLYTYSTGTPSLYTTWVYYMSPTGGFTFTNTASASTVANPCYAYTSASSAVKSTCASVAAQYGSGVVAGNAYMTIVASSDYPLINDVLYYSGSGISSELLTYGTVSPSNPYTYYPLSTYNTNLGGYTESYSNTAPNIGNWATTPTNAGYVPYSPQVLYSERGFGYGASQSATTGAIKVAMGTDPTVSTAFTAALAPETNNASSSEIKSVAGQSGIYALMNGAKSYLGGLSTASCQTQYVVLLTDGLPTLDKSGSAWPPLGTTTANAYGLTATFASDGSLATSNSQAVTDAIAAIKALNTAGIKVYVIGLGAGVLASTNPIAAQLLQAMAVAGGTTGFYPATDATSLNAAFSSIIQQIYSLSAVAAPVAPISVAGGTSDEYEMTSVASPGAGHVQAYPVTAAGIASSTAAWDAAALMTGANRTAALSAANASNAIVTLANVDTAAFGLIATACVPNVSTIISYTINPSYTSGSCSYLAGRQPGWFLGVFSTRNTGRYTGPPTSASLLLKYPSYVTYARTLATRTPMLMFTDADGFLYSVNAGTGALLWGWTSRSLLAKMQNYSAFQSGGYADGGFTVADAMDGSGNWGSYVVGSLQGGSEHYAIKLSSSGTPSAVVYDNVVANGSAAGDKAGATGTVPLRQAPVIAYIGNSAYAIYVVTAGTTSTLYETNIATGTSTSSALGFAVSSAISLNAANNQLFLGGSNGSLWAVTLASGVAATDLALIRNIGTTVVASTGAALANVLEVGYTEVSGIPYLYAINSAELTVFGVTSAGWTPLWASTPTAGYTYNGGWTVSSTVTTMTAGSVVSDLPVIVGSSLILPTYVAGTGCSAGFGYYDLYNLANGAFPTNSGITQNGVTLTADITVGIGLAFTPSLTAIAGGVALNPSSAGGGSGSGSSGAGVPQNPLVSSLGPVSKAISWRQL